MSKKIRYKCLILDHDDTAVMSTPEIHYPAFVQAIGVLRPDRKPLSLEEFFLYSFNPGFSQLCKDILGLNEDEIEYQYKHWCSCVESKSPDFYPGFISFLTAYKDAGGIITVVSHSEVRHIKRDYMHKCGFVPDLIFGWEKDESRVKPSPYPVHEIIKTFNLKKSDILVVDDLKPGLQMAKSSDVAFAGVGWSHEIKGIKDYMEENADYYFSSISDLREFIFIS